MDLVPQTSHLPDHRGEEKDYGDHDLPDHRGCGEDYGDHDQFWRRVLQEGKYRTRDWKPNFTHFHISHSHLAMHKGRQNHSKKVRKKLNLVQMSCH